jgi:hypothetical protein
MRIQLDGDDFKNLIIVLQFLLIIYLIFRERIAEWRKLRLIKVFGDYGEKLVADNIDSFDADCIFAVFHGLVGRFSSQRYEIDHLLLTHQGVVLIETKNVRGRIINKKENWFQIKRSESGKAYEREFRNPVHQIERTARIFDSFLASKGLKVAVHPVIVFSNRDTELKLTPQKVPILMLHELEEHISNMSMDFPLSTKVLRQVEKTIRENFKT